MKILVCIKQVPQKDAPLKLNESSTWIREDVSYEVNEPDAYALEEALRQKEKHGGEVVVITAGPARAQTVLREALAKGADRAIHLEDDRFATLDAANVARAPGCRHRRRKLRSDCHRAAVRRFWFRPNRGCCWQRFWAGRTRRSSSALKRRRAGLHLKRELEAGRLSACRRPSASRADNPKRHQQAALRNADRDQTGEDEAYAQGGLGRRGG